MYIILCDKFIVLLFLLWSVTGSHSSLCEIIYTDLLLQVLLRQQNMKWFKMHKNIKHKYDAERIKSIENKYIAKSHAPLRSTTANWLKKIIEFHSHCPFYPQLSVLLIHLTITSNTYAFIILTLHIVGCYYHSPFGHYIMISWVFPISNKIPLNILFQIVLVGFGSN